MTTIREFRCIDLLRFASVNLDHFVPTETMSFYLRYLGKWASYIKVAVAPCNRFIGYIIGEAHSATRDTKEGTHWRAHVTAVTVASGYRRLKSAKKLLHVFEENHNNSHRAYYTNLFVRESNIVAIKMFTKLGYINFRCIRGFYSDNEDAIEFRKFYSQVSDRDDYGNVRLGVYKAVDDLNYYANPLYIWGGGRKTEEKEEEEDVPEDAPDVPEPVQPEPVHQPPVFGDDWVIPTTLKRDNRGNNKKEREIKHFRKKKGVRG